MVGYIILGVVALFLAVVLIRTALFRPKAQPPVSGETVEFEVFGDKIEAIYMIPGWTHNIINLSETEDLVTVMTCNEIFNPKKPDTFFEKVEK